MAEEPGSKHSQVQHHLKRAQDVETQRGAPHETGRDTGSGPLPRDAPDGAPSYLAGGSVEDTYSDRERRAIRLWLRLARTSRRIEAEVSAQLQKTFGVRFVRFDLLSQLYRAPERSLSVGALGASLVAPSGNISSLLDRMEADGLVRRVPDPEDRRRYLIRMTDQGLAQFDRMAQAQAAWVAEAFAAIDDETLDRLHDELGAIATISDRRRH
ncbi:MAG: MarR family transcriptional regulator [Pseudomonadota bacterium]